MSRAQLTSTVEQNTGGAVAPFVAGKNKIINGDFGVWQRGTSFTVTTTKTYTADRFASEFSGTGATRTVSQQTFTPGAAPVAGYEGQYFLRYNRSVAGTSPTDYLTYRVENVQSFAGQTATISYWAKAASAMSLVDVTFYQEFGSGGSATVTTSTGTQAITTSWVRYTTTVAIPSISGKTIGTSSDLSIYFALPQSGTFTFDIWGVQVEAGSVATPFTTATGTLQGELAACQRYYYQITVPSTGQDDFLHGFQISLTAAEIFIGMPQYMRTLPTPTATNVTISDGVTYNATVTTISMITSTNYSTQHYGISVLWSGNNGAQYRPAFLRSLASTATSLSFSAEL